MRSIGHLLSALLLSACDVGMVREDRYDLAEAHQGSLTLYAELEGTWTESGADSVKTSPYEFSFFVEFPVEDADGACAVSLAALTLTDGEGIQVWSSPPRRLSIQPMGGRAYARVDGTELDIPHRLYHADVSFSLEGRCSQERVNYQQRLQLRPTRTMYPRALSGVLGI